MITAKEYRARCASEAVAAKHEQLRRLNLRTEDASKIVSIIEQRLDKQGDRTGNFQVPPFTKDIEIINAINGQLQPLGWYIKTQGEWGSLRYQLEMLEGEDT